MNKTLFAIGITLSVLGIICSLILRNYALVLAWVVIILQDMEIEKLKEQNRLK